jgi:probable phosphoglycerate mutase
MNIFLIRHGQTLLNQDNRHQYSSTPLSEKGVKEVQSISKHLKEAKIDKIYSSPLVRAKQTAEAISQVTGKKVVYLNELKEIKRPSEIEGKSHFEPNVQKIKQSIKRNYESKNWHHSDEENFWDVKDRVFHLMKFMENENGYNILLVTHGVAIKMFLALCIFKKELTAKEFLAFYENISISNTGITHCRYENDFGWKVLRVNDMTHLADN